MADIYIDQNLNMGSIRRFLTRKESISLFLVLTSIVTVLLVVFGQPTSLVKLCEELTRLSPLGQVSICFTTGFAILILSRAILYLVGKKNILSPAACVIWILSEMILCVSVMTLVLWALSGGGRVHLATLVGMLVLGFVSVLIVPYVVTFLVYRLHETHVEVLRLRQQLEHQEAVPQTPVDSNVSFRLKGGNLAFSTKMSNLLYIEAADNYVNIHYLNGEREETFILFNSMKNLEQEFSGSSLKRCHRRYMVNVNNVKLMRKEGISLLLELNGTTKEIPVSKGYTESITKYFAAE